MWQHLLKYAVCFSEKAETYMISYTQLNKKIKRIIIHWHPKGLTSGHIWATINQVLYLICKKKKKDVYQCFSELTLCQLQKYSMNSSIFKTTQLRFENHHGHVRRNQHWLSRRWDVNLWVWCQGPTILHKLGLKPAKQRLSCQVCLYRSQFLHGKYSAPL